MGERGYNITCVKIYLKKPWGCSSVGERLSGRQEVEGSIPSSSINLCGLKDAVSSLKEIASFLYAISINPNP